MVFAGRTARGTGSERMARSIEAFFEEKRRAQPREGARTERCIESFFERGRKPPALIHSFYPLMP